MRNPTLNKANNLRSAEKCLSSAVCIAINNLIYHDRDEVAELSAL